MLIGLAETALGRVALERGTLPVARRWLREAVLHLQACDPRQVLVSALAMLARAEATAGAVGQAREIRARAETVRSTRPTHWFNRVDLARTDATIAAVAGDLQQARAIAREAATASGEDRLSEALLLHESLRFGEPPAALAARLTEVASVVDGDLTGAFAAHTTALRAGKGEALDIVAETLAGMGSLLSAAEAYAHAAAAHRARGNTMSPNKSAARSSRLATACGGPQTPALPTAAAPVVRLSEREQQVASLAAKGLSNRAIAEALQLSTRTVESYLYRASVKIGASGRRELVDIQQPPQPR